MSGGMGMFGILFYSDTCEFSRNLRVAMRDNDIMKFFTEKCVDKMSVQEMTKMGLKETPTLVVIMRNGEAIKSKQVYGGRSAFEWVETAMRNNRENSLRHAEQSRRLIQFDNMCAKKKDNIKDFDPLESAGLSDGFAYWANDMNKDVDIAQPKSFLPYGKDDEYAIATFFNKKEQNHKLSDNDIKKRAAEVEAMRNMQDNQMKTNFERQHMNAVMKTELGYN
jgi:hypothetical protein